MSRPPQQQGRSHIRNRPFVVATFAMTADGKVTALHVATTADHGAFDAAADPSKYPAGVFGIVTGGYDFPVAHAEVDAFFTNKAPGGIAYRCSFRVTEASYAIAAILALGAVALFTLPPLGHLIGLSDHEFGLWAGLAVDNTAETTATGYLFSDEAGKIARQHVIPGVILQPSGFFAVLKAQDEGCKYMMGS